ncbi:Uncharacterised protein [Vibrio cholerae]|nr:Uncharacterised protein [Vibrio cholerae]
MHRALSDFSDLFPDSRKLSNFINAFDLDRGRVHIQHN